MKTIYFFALSLTAAGFAFGAESEPSVFELSARHVKKFAEEVRAERTQELSTALAILESHRPATRRFDVLHDGRMIKVEESILRGSGNKTL